MENSKGHGKSLKVLENGDSAVVKIPRIGISGFILLTIARCAAATVTTNSRMHS